MDKVLPIILAVFGASGFWALVQFLIDRFDKKRNVLLQIGKMEENNKKQFSTLERDLCRTQLLLMIKSYPKQHEEILKLAYHYFVTLKGNWYMEDLFDDWCAQESISIPTWRKG